MDTLINIIIVLVIVGSVMKRLREVAGKGREISAPSGAPGSPVPSPDVPRPPAPPDPLAEAMRRVQQTLEAQGRTMPTPSGPREIAWAERDDHDEEFSEDEEADVREEFVRPATISAPVPAPASIRSWKPKGRRERVMRIPGLTGTATVQAIIAMEILGPPVSLRQGGCGGVG